MEITVRLFGPEAEAVGCPQVTVRVGRASTCRELREVLAGCHPVLGPRLATCRFAVNHTFVGDEHPVVGDDEVALIGLVSGG